jgi:hypothetical protein
MWPLDSIGGRPCKAFYEPSFHTELAVYVEASVARALGFRVDAAWTSGKPGQNVRPANAVVTLVGSPPFNRQRPSTDGRLPEGDRFHPRARLPLGAPRRIR